MICFGTHDPYRLPRGFKLKSNKKDESRAKVIISTPGGNYLTLDVFGQNVAAIAEIDEAEVTADNLISAQPFSCSYNGTVMNSVTRP